MRPIGVALAVALAVAAPAPASAENVVEAAGKRAAIDWTRGLVIATGAAPADLRAPSPSIARVKARRIAGARARTALARIARKLRLAGGSEVAAVVAKDPATRARVERIVAGAREIDLQLGSDGSVVATLGLPLESVRWAMRPGGPAPRAGSGASAIVVDASKMQMKPAVGLTLAAGRERYAGPTVFHRRAGSARADPRAGSRIASATATRLAGGVLYLQGMNASALAGARKAGALVLIVLPEKKP